MRTFSGRPGRINTLVSHALHFTMLPTHRFNCLLRDVVGGSDDHVTTIRSYSSSTLISVPTGYLELRTVRGATTVQGRNVTEAILGWAFSDFEKSRAPLVYGVYAARLVWMFKGHPNPSVRQDIITSNVAYIANWILGLFELAEVNSKKNITFESYCEAFRQLFRRACSRETTTRTSRSTYERCMPRFGAPEENRPVPPFIRFFLKRPVCGMLGRLMLLGCETTGAILEGYHVGGNTS